MQLKCNEEAFKAAKTPHAPHKGGAKSRLKNAQMCSHCKRSPSSITPSPPEINDIAPEPESSPYLLPWHPSLARAKRRHAMTTSIHP